MEGKGRRCDWYGQGLEMVEGLLVEVSRVLKWGPSGLVTLEGVIDEFIFELAFCPTLFGCLLLSP